MTLKEMCETIERAKFVCKGDRLLTAEEIFEMSPTGELWHLPILYEVARVLEKKT